METSEFQGWLEAIDALSEEQRTEVRALLAGRPSAEEVIAALEMRMLAERRCPHCAQKGAICRGTANGFRRFYCRGCGKTFNALSGTPLAGLHHRERWLAFARSLSAREVVRKSAETCAIAVSTAFRWRHRFLAAIKTDAARLGGIVEADETYVRESRKGSRAWKQAKEKPGAVPPDRKPRKRGGKAAKPGHSPEQVAVLVAADRSGATMTAVLPSVVTGQALADALRSVLQPDVVLVTDGGTPFRACADRLGVTHEALRLAANERVRGAFHIQTVNSRHERFKDMLRRHRGVATKHLASYLKWFHLAVIQPNPTPRACLNAAIWGLA